MYPLPDGQAGGQVTPPKGGGPLPDLVLPLTTAGADVIVVVVIVAGGTVQSVSDAAALVWHRRASQVTASGNTIEEWYAHAPAPLAADNISVAATAGATSISGCFFGVSGVDPGELYDTNPSLPGRSAALTHRLGVLATVSTDNPAVLLFVAADVASGTFDPNLPGEIFLGLPLRMYAAPYGAALSALEVLALGTSNVSTNGALIDVLVGTLGVDSRFITRAPARSLTSEASARQLITRAAPRNLTTWTRPYPAMPQGRDFSAVNVGEVVNGTFDFDTWLLSGVTLLTANVACTLFAGSDPTPAVRVIGAARIVASPLSGGASRAVLQQWGNMLDQNTYIMTATVTTSDGQTLVMWARQPCQSSV